MLSWSWLSVDGGAGFKSNLSFELPLLNITSLFDTESPLPLDTYGLKHLRVGGDLFVLKAVWATSRSTELPLLVDLRIEDNDSDMPTASPGK